MKTEKVRFYHDETFKEIDVDPSLKLRYAVSNKGRMISFTDEIANGRLLKGANLDGYRIFIFNIYREGKAKKSHFFIYKLVAQYFMPKSNENQQYIIHLDYCRSNDDTKNLKWVTKEEREEHISKSPFIIESRKNLAEYKKRGGKGSKLTATRVMMIKKLLANPNRKTRIKMIAKQFGVSENQIFRIKRGENWGNVNF